MFGIRSAVAAASAGQILAKAHTPPLMRTYEIIYRLKTGNSGQQRTTIQASDQMTARRIFEQQNSGCIVEVCREAR